MCDSSDLEGNEKKCSICSQNQTSPHFGSSSCQACASFFRRTVSLNLRYVCRKQGKCSIFYKVRLVCRSCRFDKCLQSGMQREAVQPLRYYTKLPKYVEQFKKSPTSDTILRVYATSALSDYVSSQELNSSTSSSPAASPKPSNYSTILNISHDDLLQFYCEQTSFSLNQRQNANYELGDVAFQFCKICPGVDLLGSDELELLHKYSFFTCEILDSVWAETQFPDSYLSPTNRESSSSDAKGLLFFEKIKRDMYDCLKFWNLNGVEYSSLKAMCIWKLGICDFTVSMKVVSQEQYSSICSALTTYFKGTLKKEEIYCATRIADFTLVLGKIFESYCDMIVGFEKNNIPLTFSPDNK